MTDYDNAIEINGITKKYDGFTLDNVTFNVPKGTIMGFIGQNGAGKTTTIRAMLNIIGIDSGEIKLLGKDHIKDEYDVKGRIAVVFDELPFHDSFTGAALSKMFSGLYGAWDEKRFFELCDRFGLPVKKKLSKFSKGMKMKMQIATALSHNAELLIMDEATTGLDPVVRNEILDMFREYLIDGERSVLMSSHITSDLEKIADCVTFIDRGKVLLTGYKDEVLDSHGMIKCTKADFKEIDPADTVSARVTDLGAEVLTADRAGAAKKYSGLTVEKTTLEEIMLFYVNREKKEWS